MAQNSGFFDALLSGGEYDRTYSSADYCDNLATIINNGVRYSAEDDLKVTPSTGLRLNVAAGRAWINGHYFYNDSNDTSILLDTAPTGSNRRIDRVVIRLDTRISGRCATLEVLRGTASANPSAPVLTRSGDVYEIAIADVLIYAGVTTITQTMITDQRANGTVCGWASSVTPAIMSLLKRYEWNDTLTGSTRIVSFDIPQFNAADVHILDIYTNGIIETLGEDYTLSGNTITFTTARHAGNEIKVILYKSIDGTGLESVSDEVTTLQNQVAQLMSEELPNYKYICTGTADNIAISDIAQDFLNGTGDFEGVPEYAQMKLTIYGTCGVSYAYSGTGTADNYYKWFALGKSTSTNRKITFDFTPCDAIYYQISGDTTNMIIYGSDVNIIGLRIRVDCTAANCDIYGFMQTAGNITVENCGFEIVTTGLANLARCGTFINCTAFISSANSTAIVFRMVSDISPICVFGGSYRSYTGSGAQINSVVYSPAGTANAVCYLSGVRFPTVAVSPFYQSHAIRINSGYLTAIGIITALQLTSASAATVSITGTIPISA